MLSPCDVTDCSAGTAAPAASTATAAAATLSAARRPRVRTPARSGGSGGAYAAVVWTALRTVAGSSRSVSFLAGFIRVLDPSALVAELVAEHRHRPRQSAAYGALGDPQDGRGVGGGQAEQHPADHHRAGRDRQQRQRGHGGAVGVGCLDCRHPAFGVRQDAFPPYLATPRRRPVEPDAEGPAARV